MTYLEDAADLLRKASAGNEKIAARMAELEAGNLDTGNLAREINDRRLEIAEGLTRLAAIEAGLPPCCHPLRPVQDQETP